MIKVIYGPKGTGKTKMLVDSANEMAGLTRGVVVFIDNSDQLILSLDHRIRFVNVSDFPMMGSEAFFGFICGILSQNYDIEGVFIDRLNNMTKEKAADLEMFFGNLEKVAEKSGINFTITISGQEEEMPSFLGKYTGRE